MSQAPLGSASAARKDKWERQFVNDLHHCTSKQTSLAQVAIPLLLLLLLLLLCAVRCIRSIVVQSRWSSVARQTMRQRK